jgi:hypothetical protein
MNANIKDGNMGRETRTRGRHLLDWFVKVQRWSVRTGGWETLRSGETYMLFLSCAQYSDNQTPEL